MVVRCLETGDLQTEMSICGRWSNGGAICLPYNKYDLKEAKKNKRVEEKSNSL